MQSDKALGCLSQGRKPPQLSLEIHHTTSAFLPTSRWIPPTRAAEEFSVVDKRSHNAHTITHFIVPVTHSLQAILGDEFSPPALPVWDLVTQKGEGK